MNRFTAVRRVRCPARRRSKVAGTARSPALRFLGSASRRCERSRSRIRHARKCRRVFCKYRISPLLRKMIGLFFDAKWCRFGAFGRKRVEKLSFCKFGTSFLATFDLRRATDRSFFVHSRRCFRECFVRRGGIPTRPKKRPLHSAEGSGEAVVAGWEMAEECFGLRRFNPDI